MASVKTWKGAAPDGMALARGWPKERGARLHCLVNVA